MKGTHLYRFETRLNTTDVSLSRIKDQGFRREIFARDSIGRARTISGIIVRGRKDSVFARVDSRDYRYTSPLVHIFLRFHAYSVNSTLPSWPHKSTTQWRVARESIFIVAKCIKLRYRQSLSYSCTRARLPSLQDFRACVCVRVARCARVAASLRSTCQRGRVELWVSR